MPQQTKPCRFCGNEMPSDSEFCLSCGRPQTTRQAPPIPKKRSFRPFLIALPALAFVLALTFSVLFFTGRLSDPASPEEEQTPPDAGTTREIQSEESVSSAALPDPVEAEPTEETGEEPLTTPLVSPPVTTSVTGEEKKGSGDEPALPDPDRTDADGTLHHGALSVRLQNDLTSETGNYFFYVGSSFQTFRITRCDLYSAGEALSVRGSATAITPAETADQIEVWIFYEGQNQTTAPLFKKEVTVIRQGVNEGLTVAFDLPVCEWSRLADTGYSDFVLFLAAAE